MPPWATLPRATDDNQTINEAIDASIASHNADAEAHMNTDEAIEAHRNATVVDHPPESVVNDKIAIRSRSYNAIVDPDDDQAFDTLEDAYDYCVANNFGNILVVAGTHYFSSNLEIDPRVNIYGEGRNETIILPNTDNTYSFNIGTSALGSSALKYRCELKNFTLGSTTKRFIGTQTDYPINALIENVEFGGWAGEWVWGIIEDESALDFISCKFNLTSSTPTIYLQCTTIRNSYIASNSSSSNGFALSSAIVENNIFRGISSATNIGWFDGLDYFTVIKNNQFWNCGNCIDAGDFNNEPKKLIVDGNYFSMGASSRIDISTDGAVFSNNKCIHASGNSVRFKTGTTRAIGVGNQTTQAITDSGTGTGLSANVLI